MSNAPLGEIFIDLKLNFDPNSQKTAINRIKNATQKIAAQIQKIIAHATAEGLSKGAEKGAEKIGRFGFGGGGFGFLTPFQPKVMAAYISGRYMHMGMNVIFKTIDEAISKYFLGATNAIKEIGINPMQNLLKNLSKSKEILPSMSTKAALFLEEETIGTGLKATDIVSELKKMIDANQATTPEDALSKYLKLVSLNNSGMNNQLGLFGGSEAIAHQFKYSNVKDNLINVLSDKEFSKYANTIDKLLKVYDSKEANALLERGEVAKSMITDYSANKIEKDIKKEIKKKKEDREKGEYGLKIGLLKASLSSEDLTGEAIEELLNITGHARMTRIPSQDNTEARRQSVIEGKRRDQEEVTKATNSILAILDILRSIYDVLRPETTIFDKD